MRVLPAIPTPAMRRQRSPDPDVVPHVHQVVELGAARRSRCRRRCRGRRRCWSRSPRRPPGCSRRRGGSGCGLRRRRDSRTRRRPITAPALMHHPAADRGAGVADRARADHGVLPDGHPVPQRHALGQPAPVAEAARPGPAPRTARSLTSCPSTRPGPEPRGRDRRPGRRRGRGKQRADHADQRGVGVRARRPGRAGPRRLARAPRAPARPPRARRGGRRRSGARPRGTAASGPAGRSGADRPDHHRPIAKQAATDEIGDRLRGEACLGHGLRCPS